VPASHNADFAAERSTARARVVAALLVVTRPSLPRRVGLTVQRARSAPSMTLLGRLHRLLRRGSPSVLERVADGQRGAHDTEVGFDGFAFVVVDQPRFTSAACDPKSGPNCVR
jgi:hypothetical protein